MGAQETAIENLKSLGLSDYEARCLISLCQSTPMSATELSNASGIPRSNVYTITDRLADREFVEIIEAHPREFRAAPVEQIISALQTQYQARIEELEHILPQLEDSTEAPVTGMWSISGRERVLDRARSLISEAEETAVLTVRPDGLLVEDCLHTIQEAIDRGVDVSIFADDSMDVDNLLDRVDGASVSPLRINWLGLPLVENQIGRVVLVDDENVLIATIDDSTPPSVEGVWARGSDLPLVTMVQQILYSRLEE